MNFTTYRTGGFYDEIIQPDGRARPGAVPLVHMVEALSTAELLRRQRTAEQALLHLGITFNVYGDTAGEERIFPFDIIPRIVSAADWEHIEAGLQQRIQALNLFLDDIYHAQKIVKDGVVPAPLIHSATGLWP